MLNIFFPKKRKKKIKMGMVQNFDLPIGPTYKEGLSVKDSIRSFRFPYNPEQITWIQTRVDFYHQSTNRSFKFLCFIDLMNQGHGPQVSWYKYIWAGLYPWLRASVMLDFRQDFSCKQPKKINYLFLPWVHWNN